MKGLFKSKKAVVLSVATVLVVALSVWCVVDAGTGIQRVNNYAVQSEPVRQAISDYHDRMAELNLPEITEGQAVCPDYADWLYAVKDVDLRYPGIDLAEQTAYAQMAVQGRILGWFNGEQDSTQFIVLVTRDIVGKRGVLRTLRVAVRKGSNCAKILKEAGEVVLFLDVINKDKALTRLHSYEHSIFEVEFLDRVHSYSNMASNRYYNGKSANKLVKTIKELARKMEIE